MSHDVKAAYVESAHAWRGAPEKVYAALATALVHSSPVPVRGARVLDVGAGTGVGVRAAQAVGSADVIGVDLADTMLRIGGLTGRSAVADVDHIPFADNSFDLAIASCVLSHVPRPEHSLTELLRVSRAVAVSAFPQGWSHPVKLAVDSVAKRHGFVAPQWHVDLKDIGELRVGTPERLRTLAGIAGWTVCDVRLVNVRTGLTAATDLAQWRLGLAHMAPWLASLSEQERTEVEWEAVAALADGPELVAPLLVLTSLGSGHR